MTLDKKEQALEDTISSYCKYEHIGLNIVNSSRAFYKPIDDTITVPRLNQYKDKVEYLATLSHESIHSTGNPLRLNRIDISDQPDAAYSKEELVAELGAAMLLAEYGIEGSASRNNSVAYIKGWLKHLQDDVTLITYAAQRAQKAVDYIQEYRVDQVSPVYEVEQISKIKQTNTVESFDSLGNTNQVQDLSTTNDVDLLEEMGKVAQFVVKSYITDFTKFDTDTLKSAEKGDVFYWIPRKTGTALINLDHLKIKSDSKYGAWSSMEYFNYYCSESMFEDHLYRVQINDFNGNTPTGAIQKITVDSALEEIKQVEETPISIEVLCRGEKFTFTMDEVSSPAILSDHLDYEFNDSISGDEIEYKIRF